MPHHGWRELRSWRTPRRTVQFLVTLLLTDTFASNFLRSQTSEVLPPASLKTTSISRTTILKKTKSIHSTGKTPSSSWPILVTLVPHVIAHPTAVSALAALAVKSSTSVLACQGVSVMLAIAVNIASSPSLGEG